MPLLNTTLHYGSVTKTFHWLTFLLITVTFPLGMYANDLPIDTLELLSRKAWYFSLHKTLGVTVFGVASARIIWALFQPKPVLLKSGHWLEAFAAETVHWMLYLSLVIVPLTGWITHAASEVAAPIWGPVGQSLFFVPKSESMVHLFGILHSGFTNILLFAVLAHIAGALKHAFIDRDQTLQRMLPGQPDLPDMPVTAHPRLPLFLALGLFAAAMALGSIVAITGIAD